MATYRIVPQIEKQGQEEEEVLCKHVRFYPIKNKKGAATGNFGRFGFPIFKVLLECVESASEHYITWSNFSGAVNGGKYIYHMPNKTEHPKMWVGEGKRRKQIVDTLSPMIEVPGDTHEFTSADALVAFLVPRLGEELTIDVLDAFEQRMMKHNEKKAAKAAKAA